MRANKYLYHVQLDDGVHYVIFNGFNKEFLILVEKALPSMMELINKPNDYTSTHPKILQRLAALKFIVEDDFDERATLVLFMPQNTKRLSFLHSNVTINVGIAYKSMSLLSWIILGLT